MAPTHSESTTRGGFSLPALAVSVRRALPTLIVVAALVAAAVFLLMDRMTPLYRAETQLALGISATNPAVLSSTLDGEVQLIRSRDLARQVVGALGLAAVPDYRAASEGQVPFQDFLVALGLSRDLRALSPEERVFALYDDNLAVKHVGGPAVIRIGFWAADPVLAAQGANAVADAYVALRQSATDEATGLATEISRLQGVVSEAETRASGLRVDIAAMVTLDDDERAALLTERAETLALADAAHADAQAIRSALAAGTLPDVTVFRDDPTVVAFRKEQAELGVELARELAANPLGNARVTEIGARLAEIRAALRTEANRIAVAREADTLAAEDRLAALDAQLADADAAEAAARELATLERQILADRETLGAALGRQATLTQGGMLPTSVRVINHAGVPRAPSWPDTIALTALAFAAALLAGVLIAALRALLNGDAFRREAFAPLSGIDVPPPAAAKMRRVDEDAPARASAIDEPTLSPEIAPEASLGEVADSIAGRRRIIATLAEESDAEGRPLAAVALARALSGRDRSVVLVDLRADGANEAAMGENDDLVGFSDLLSGEASFSEAIFRDRRSRAHFIPLGSRPVSIETLGGERLATLLTALDHTYDHVVIDCPDDVIARIAPGADAALVASEHGSSDPRTTRAVARVAKASDAHVYHLLVEPTRRSPEREAA